MLDWSGTLNLVELFEINGPSTVPQNLQHGHEAAVPLDFPGMNDDPAQTVFGDNLIRLIEVKPKHDLDNRFHFNMNIKPRKKPVP